MDGWSLIVLIDVNEGILKDFEYVWEFSIELFVFLFNVFNYHIVFNLKKLSEREKENEANMVRHCLHTKADMH